MIVGCGSCQSKFKIDPAKVPVAGTRIRCPKCKGVITVGSITPAAAGPQPGAAAPAAPKPAAGHGAHARAPNPTHGPDGEPAPHVLIAHGNAAFCETLSGFLERNHFACEVVADGEAALALLAERRPAVLLVDVALPGIVGYKLCEQIKSAPMFAGLRVVLIGAIYDRTRYRRPPASLYGSDGYIEKHEIPDKLVPMLRQLVAGGAPAEAAAPLPSPAGAEVGASPRSAREETGGKPSSGASPGSEQARRLARIIVSDIVLYNPDVVKRGIADGNLLDLLKDDLKEGRDLLKARVGAEAGGNDYVLEALKDYVRRMASRSTAAAQR